MQTRHRSADVMVRHSTSWRAVLLHVIYVLFEHGESAHGSNRIVRVGTLTGSGQLPSRLTQHFVHSR